MRPQHSLSVLLILVVLSVFSIPALAQSDIQVYTTYDGLVSFTLPDGWVVDQEGDIANMGFFSIASSEDALQVMRDNSAQGRSDPVAPGDAGVIIFRSGYLLQNFSIGQPGDTPLDTLQTMFGSQLADLGIEIQQAEVGAYTAAFFNSADESSAGAVYMLDLGDGGIIGFAFSTASSADYADLEPVLLGILESLEFGGDAYVHYSPDGFLPVSKQWSPDSQTYALIERYELGERAESVALYSVSGRLIKEVIGLGAVWNSDGSQAALFGDIRGSAVEVIDTTTGETLFALGTGATSVKWSPDDRFIVAGDLRQALRIWDAATGRQLYSLDPAQSWVFNAEGSLLAAWDYGGTEVRVIDISTGAELWTAPRAEIFFDAIYDIPEVRWTPDGTRLLVVSPDGIPALHDGLSGAVTVSYPPSAAMEFTSIIQQGDNLALIYRTEECRTGNCQSEVASLDLQTGTERFRVTQNDSVGSIAWSPDGTRMALATTFSVLNVTLWDAQTGEPVWETLGIDALSSRATLFWIGDSALAIRGSNSALPLLDAASGEILAMNQDNESDRLAFNEDQSLMLVAGGQIVRMRDTTDGTQIMALPHDSDVTSAEWSADESLIFTRMEGGAFTAWDATTGRRLVQIYDRINVAEPDRSLFAYLSPDAQWVLTFLSGGSYARVWPLGARLEAAREAVAAETLTLEDYLDASDAAVEAGDLEGIIAANQAVLNLDPDNARAINAVGVAYYRQGELTKAMDTLNLAAEIDPTYLLSYRNMGDIYRRENAFGAARSKYEDGLAASVTDEERALFYNRIGLTYSSEQAYAEAAAQFTLAIELDATDPIFFRNRGYMNYNQGESFYPQVITDFEQYVELAGAEADAETIDLLNTLKSN